MPIDLNLALTSEALLSELRQYFPLQMQPSVSGWRIFEAGGLRVLWVRHDQIRALERHDLEGATLALEEDYSQLKAWAERGYRIAWLNRSGAKAPTRVPMHDLELSALDELFEADLAFNYPTTAQCWAYYEAWDLPENVQRHVITVGWTAYVLAVLLQEKGLRVDSILTHRGGLLHDLDKIKTLSMANAHGQMSAEFLDSEGYPAVAEIIRGHNLSHTLDPDWDEGSWEMKLVNFCDKLVEGDRIVPLGERFTALGKRYPVFMKKMTEAKKRVWELNSQICSTLFIPDHESLIAVLKAQENKVV